MFAQLLHPIVTVFTPMCVVYIIITMELVNTLVSGFSSTIVNQKKKRCVLFVTYFKILSVAIICAVKNDAGACAVLQVYAVRRCL